MDLGLSTTNVELTQVRFLVWLTAKEAKKSDPIKKCSCMAGSIRFQFYWND